MRGTPPRHQEQPAIAWHALEIDEVFRRLESTPEGLDGATAGSDCGNAGPTPSGPVKAP